MMSGGTAADNVKSRTLTVLITYNLPLSFIVTLIAYCQKLLIIKSHHVSMLNVAKHLNNLHTYRHQYIVYAGGA